jgi:hypothetical protein
MMRDAFLIVVSTRPLNVVEELERSRRGSDGAGHRLGGRVLTLNAARGELAEYFRDRPALGDEGADNSATLGENGTGEFAPASVPPPAAPVESPP